MGSEMCIRDSGVSVANEVTASESDFHLGPIASTVIEKGIPLEICPTSNLHTGVVNSFNEHPVDTLLRSGFQVSINTDNRLMSATSMSNEFWECHNSFGWGWKEIKAITKTSIHHAFIPLEEKNSIMKRIDSWYETRIFSD